MQVHLYFTSFMWMIWDNLLWRLFSGKYRIPPNINGQWVGRLKSSYLKTMDEKKIDIKIKQKFSNIKIEVKTNEILSSSISASWLDDNSLYPRLFYSYQTKPIVLCNKNNLPQYGSGILCIETSTNITIEYWTSQQTHGSIKIVKVSSKVDV